MSRYYQKCWNCGHFDTIDLNEEYHQCTECHAYCIPQKDDIYLDSKKMTKNEMLKHNLDVKLNGFKK